MMDSSRKMKQTFAQNSMEKTLQKMNGESLDISAENRARLKALLPSVFTETENGRGETVESMDFEKLKAELGTFTDLFENRHERYGMNWPGKKDILKLIQTPCTATLKPCREESVNFDTTENLFIEGDNLEVLKLLQKSYYGKVKMIYIDPPYNTGKDFIYPDNFGESLATYLEYAGLADSEGRRFSTNTPNEGRFHTKWLNMMYPRLYLARNLLREDGVIFISIDDNEVSNLRKICDEIFGEDNFVGVFTWRSRTAKADVPYGTSKDVEWVVCYCKQDFIAGRAGERNYYHSDDYADGWRLQDLTKNTTKEQRQNSYFIMVNPKNGDEYPASETRTWSVTKKTFQGYYDKGKIVFPGDYDFLNIKKPAFRVFESEDKKKTLEKYRTEEVKMSVSTYLPEKDVGRTEHGSKEIRALFGAQVFSYPKPTSLIKFFIDNISDPEAIIMDFFVGSGTTAEAVLRSNDGDGGNRKFVVIQLPEPLDPKSTEQKTAAEYCKANSIELNIAALSRERIRRVIKNLNEEKQGELKFKDNSIQDRGFKAFKLDKSNFRLWKKLHPDSESDEITKQMEFHVNHIDPEAMPEDLLYEILIKAGIAPTEKVETVELAEIPVFSISAGELLICLEDRVSKKLISAVVKAEPKQFICLDAAFHGDDQLKANAAQTFAALNADRDTDNQIAFKTI